MVCHPLSQIGEHGGKLGWCLIEESRPRRRRHIQMSPIEVSHARDKSREARPGAKLQAGDPGRSRVGRMDPLYEL